MATFGGLNLKQSEVSGILDSILTVVEERRMQTGQTYERLIREANDSAFPDQREQAFVRADHFKSVEDEMKRLKVQIVQVIEDHGVTVTL